MHNRSSEWNVLFGVEFDSIQEMLEVKLSEQNADHSQRILFLPAETAKAQDGERSWRGGMSSVEEVKEFINNGWEKGVAQMRESVKALTVHGVKSIKRRKKWTDEGDEIDMCRVYSGELDHAWLSTERKLSDGGVTHLTVWVQTGFLCTHNPKDFFWRGAIACLMVDALEEAGYRVEVKGYYCGTQVFSRTRSGRIDCIYTYPLKSFEEPLNIDRMAAVTATAQFFRCAGFAVKMSAPYSAEYGLGQTYHSRPSWMPESDINIGDGISTLEAATEAVDEMMKRFEGSETASL
jgi:hypothetical protein